MLVEVRLSSLWTVTVEPDRYSLVQETLMEIDRRAFIASLGGAAVVEAMCRKPRPKRSSTT